MGVNVRWYCRTCKVYADIPYGSYHYLAERLRKHIPKGHEAHDTIEASGDWHYGIEGGVLYAAGPYMSRGEVLIDFNKDVYTEAVKPALVAISRDDLVTDAQRKLWDAGIHRWPNCPQEVKCYRECEHDCKPLSEWFDD